MKLTGYNFCIPCVYFVNTAWHSTGQHCSSMYACTYRLFAGMWRMESHPNLKQFDLDQHQSFASDISIRPFVSSHYTHVFSGHLFLLTSCRSLALTLFSVLAFSVQLHQPFGIPFLTLSVHPIHLTLSGAN